MSKLVALLRGRDSIYIIQLEFHLAQFLFSDLIEFLVLIFRAKCLKNETIRFVILERARERRRVNKEY